MSRDARPLNPEAMAAFVAACHEEIDQGSLRNGLICLLAVFTGVRKRILTHMSVDWIQETEDGLELSLPKQIACNIDDDGGCNYCNKDKSRGEDGFLRPKTGQGEQRTIPIPKTWYCTYDGEKKETKLPQYIDDYFRYNDIWGIKRQQVGNIVKKVAMRRHDTLKTEHQGENKRSIQGRQVICPNIHTHDLRASWCGQCLRMGTNDTTIMDWGGWKNSDMIDHYRQYIGDPTGSERAKLEGDGNVTSDNDSASEIIATLAENGLLNTGDTDPEQLKEMVDGL